MVLICLLLDLLCLRCCFVVLFCISLCDLICAVRLLMLCLVMVGGAWWLRVLNVWVWLLVLELTCIYNWMITWMFSGLWLVVCLVTCIGFLWFWVGFVVYVLRLVLHCLTLLFFGAGCLRVDGVDWFSWLIWGLMPDLLRFVLESMLMFWFGLWFGLVACFDYFVMFCFMLLI